jgi:hypothetical protein
VAPLIDRLSASNPADRPASADQALAMLSGTAASVPGPATDPTEPLPQTEPTAAPGRAPRAAFSRRARRRRLTRALPLAALAAIALALLLVSGNGDERSPSGPRQPGQATGPPGASNQQATDATPTAPAREPESEGVSCSALEKEKKALEDEKKAAEESAGDDQPAKEAIKARFEADKKALDQRAKTCQER